MSTIAYRATIFAPKSADPTETTVLTPRSGAAHGDEFKVTTVQGLAGWQPYLDRVLGRSGSVDPLTKHTDVGGLTITVGDMRVAADTSDVGVERWLTAFAGDLLGRWALPACRVLIEESTDWDGTSGTWAPYFTGRTESVSADGLLRRGLRVKDLSMELDQPIFDDAPHPSITYAARARLWPVGLPIAWGDEPATDPIEMTYTTTVTLGGVVSYTGFTATAYEPSVPRIITKDLAGRFLYSFEGQADCRVRVRPQTGTNAGVTLTVEKFGAYPASIGGDAEGILEIVPLQAALPAIDGGTVCDVWIDAPAGEPLSETFPLLIGDVHPVQLLQDLLDGYFGQLNSTTGDPDFPVAYDASTFTALLADDTLPAMRFVIDERETSLREFIVDEILAPCNLGHRFDALGRFALIDLRQPTSTPSSVAIGSDDLVASTNRAAWEFSSAAVGRLEGTYYVDAIATDAQLRAAGPTPDIPPTRFRTSERVVVFNPIDARRLDFARKPHRIKARGFRTTVGEDGGARETVLQQQFSRLGEAFDGPFGMGAAYAAVRVGRGAAGAGEGLTPGAWVSLDVNVLENPATCTRGGARLLRVVEVSDEGIGGLERRLKLLDPGPNPVAGPPNAPTAAAVQGTPTTTSGVVRFTMPLSNLPAYLRPRIDGGTWGADVAVSVGVGATQDVEFAGLTPGTTYAADALGVSATGVVSTSSSPDASLTTGGAATIPTPSLSGGKVGSVLSLSITPGLSTPSGVTWIIERAGAYFDETVSTAYENLVPGGVVGWTVYGTLGGYADSAVSNTVTL